MTGATNISKIGALYVDTRGQLLTNLPTMVERGQIIGGIDCSTLSPPQNHPFFKKELAQQEAEFSLRQKLAKEGMEYEAILPLEFLEELRLKFGLFKFMRIDEEGKVLARLAAPPAPVDHNAVILFGTLFWPLVLGGFFNFPGIITGIALALIGVALTATSEQKTLEKKFSDQRACMAFANVCNPVAYWFTYKQMQREGTQDALKARFWGRKKTDEDLLHLSEEERSSQKIGEVAIETPKAPPEVKQRVIAWSDAGYTVSLLVEEGGFKIKKDSNLLDQLKVYNDPISFTVIHEDGHDFGVLIHQYGLLEKEQEMLEYVKEHFEAIRNNYFSQS